MPFSKSEELREWFSSKEQDPVSRQNKGLWKDGSVTKSKGSSSRGPELVAHNQIIGSNVLFWCAVVQAEKHPHTLIRKS